jgi:chlorite dismutase
VYKEQSMTTVTPSATPAARPEAAEAQRPSPTNRQYVRYAFYRVLPSWRSLPRETRAHHRAEVLAALEPFAERMPVFRAFSTLGTRGDADFMFWMVSERLEDFQEVQAALFASALGPHLEISHSFLAMTKRSQYVDKHVHPGQEGRRTQIRPIGRQYLFVYPMVKKRAWYRLPQDERQRMMDEHIRVGHEFPRVKINTTYSFGLDDQEFVVAFESDYPSDFLDLVERLRGSEVSSYTERETPIFTCVAGSVAEVLELVG